MTLFTKEQIFKNTEQHLVDLGFQIVRKDESRPWGGFFVIDETQAQKFVELYFPDVDQSDLIANRKVSPKILIVAPNQRLSWQYHFRRSEVWTVVDGSVGVVKSLTDEEGPLGKYEKGDLIILAKGERHRLVGLDDWGMVAEIWQHTDPEHPSDEEDIVRLQDDYGRN